MNFDNILKSITDNLGVKLEDKKDEKLNESKVNEEDVSDDVKELEKSVKDALDAGEYDKVVVIAQKLSQIQSIVPKEPEAIEPDEGEGEGDRDLEAGPVEDVDEPKVEGNEPIEEAKGFKASYVAFGEGLTEKMAVDQLIQVLREAAKRFESKGTADVEIEPVEIKESKKEIKNNRRNYPNRIVNDRYLR